MKTTTLAALVTASALTALAAPATAQATTHKPACNAEIKDTIVKADTGHGTPAEWADLRLARATTIQCVGPDHYKVMLVDRGTLKTRPGGGTPAGTGGTIAHRVPGTVYGVYGLNVVGHLSIPSTRDTTLSSTAYVTDLFAQGAQVKGGPYAWRYTTGCERWLDSSTNNDGQGAAAGNITGKVCKSTGHPTGTPSATPTAPSSGGDGTATPTTVPVGAPQTGDGSTSGGSHSMAWIAGGAALILVALIGGVTWILFGPRHRGLH